MNSSTLDDRLMVQIELCLTGTSDPADAIDLERRARSLGLSGAEIDAARQGRSFDVRASAAAAFAVAARGAGPRGALAARAQALRLGLASNDLDAIELWLQAAL